MYPRTLDELLKALSIILGLFLGIAFLSGCSQAYDIFTVIEFFIVGFVSYCILSLGFVYLAPVRCSKPDCKGWMKPGWKSANADCEYIWNLFYVCETCGEIYYSCFSLSVGFGETY